VTNNSHWIFLTLGLLSACLFPGCSSRCNFSYCTPLDVATAAIPDAIQGRTYNFHINTMGGSGSLGNCGLSSATLPTCRVAHKSHPAEIEISLMMHGR